MSNEELSGSTSEQTNPMELLRANKLPRRRFVSESVRQSTDLCDEHGFLAESKESLTVGVLDLFARPAVLVLAPPWTGKTFVAKQLKRHFAATSGAATEDNPFGRFTHLVLFEQFGSGARVEPGWWSEWQQTQQRACWVVDAIDEDERHGRRMHEILDHVQGLVDEQRARLCLLMFCRENELPEQVVNRLEQSYSLTQPTGAISRIRLAPLDRYDAQRCAGLGAEFERTCILIQRNHLQAVAALPCVLQELATLSADANPHVADLWRMVLKRMLRDPREDRLPSSSAFNLDDQFRAIARIAAALTFSGRDEVDAGLGYSVGPNVAEAFNDCTPRCDELRRAAARALGSAAFFRTATGFRFSQKHVQEWFAAFGLESMKLAGMRALLADGAGKPFACHQGISGLLAQISARAEVREWIRATHGGIPPRSDAAPWTLDQVRTVLDRLQDFARQSPWGLALWGGTDLEQVATPGLGGELCLRLQKPGVKPTEVRLLLNIARVNRTREVVPIALQIVRDREVSSDIRVLAGYVLKDVGDAAALAQVQQLVTRSLSRSAQTADLAAILVCALFEKGIWNFSKVLRYAPARVRGYGDARAWLQMCLRDAMTLSDARVLLAEFRRRAMGRKSQSRTQQALGDLVPRAIELVLAQTEPPQGDYNLLTSLILHQPAHAEWADLTIQIVEAFKRDPEARRRFHLASLTERTSDAAHRFPPPWVLIGEDAEWLADEAESRTDASAATLWQQALALAYRADAPPGACDSVRARANASDPDSVREFDRDRKKYDEYQKKYEKDAEKRKKKALAEQVTLTKAIEWTLENSSFDARERMHRLSWICFADEHYRPHNVVGRWDDLPDRLKERVVRTCERGLLESDSTAIPEGNAYPGTIIYESQAFVEVLARSRSYALDAEQIRRWLPATILFSIRDVSSALKRCMEADRSATEDVILDAIRHELGSKEGGGDSASSLPVEYWSERLICRTSELVADESLPLLGRSHLLDLLAARSPRAVQEVIEQWLGGVECDEAAGECRRAAAIGALFRVDPGRAMSELETDATDSGRVEALKTNLLWLKPRVIADKLNGLTGTEQVRMYVLLRTAFTPESDSPPQYGVAYHPGPEHDHRDLRNSIPVRLLNRDASGDARALDELAKQYPDIQGWLESERANRAAAGLLASAALPIGGGREASACVPVADVVRLLDDADYRLIRSAEDLQRVLVEELEYIAGSVGDHLSMLYAAPPRGQDRGERKQLNEDALQAYLHCRLTDRLPGRVLRSGTQVMFLNREPLAARNRKLDLKVQAPTVGGQPATVVVEVKWSDNADVSTSQELQLVKQYMLDSKISSGIYLVGWCGPGSWKPMARGTGPAERSMEAWRKALQDQAEELRGAHPLITLQALVVDLRWRESET